MASAPIEVISLNLWNISEPLAVRMRRLVEYLHARCPTVLAVQEVADVDGSNQAELLATACGYDHLIHDQVKGSEGLAILTDLEVVGHGHVTLPRAPDDPVRLAHWADLSVPGGGCLRLVNTHLAWRLDAGEHRVAQMTALRDAAGTDLPVCVVGDLNDGPGSAALRVLEQPDARWPGVYDALPATAGHTFDVGNPYAQEPALLGRRVDHVLVSSDIDVLEAGTALDGRDGPVVSDHYAVRAVICP